MLCMHYFLSVSQLSSGSKHRAIAMNQNPSSTIINLDEECSASHSVDEDFSEQPAGIHSVYETKSNKHLISPCNITPESNIKGTRIKEMTTNKRSS